MNHVSRAATRQLWSSRIERFKQCDQTIAKFCAQEGCSQASFYQWRRTLQNSYPAKPSLATFVPVKLSGDLSDQSTQPTTVMSVELLGGTRVRLEVIHAGGVHS